MGPNPKPKSTPPDTGKIDSNRNETSSLADTDGDQGSDRPTEMPPKEEYEAFAYKATQSSMMSEETRKALSTPCVPALESDDHFIIGFSCESQEMDASFPMFRQQPSGPYEIPLELRDDGREIHPSDRPTKPQLKPPSDYQFDTVTTRPTPRMYPPEPDGVYWLDEAATLTAATPGAEEALRAGQEATTPGILSGAQSDSPDITIEGEGFTLDDPDGIYTEDSLELSLENIPPAPFEARSDPSDVDSQPPETLPEQRCSLELSLDSEGDALDLVAARATPIAPEPSDHDPLIDLRDRYAVGDFTGAHETALSILAVDPDNAEALRFRDSCRDVLIQMYTARLGAPFHVPRIAIPTAELQWLSLDHRTGFLLSCVDGRSTVDEILDVSGMPKLDALRILYTLLQQQIIEVVGW